MRGDMQVRFGGRYEETYCRKAARRLVPSLQVAYEEEELKDLRFSGAAEKYNPVEFLLKMIEEVTKVRFDIEGKRIMVKNN